MIKTLALYSGGLSSWAAAKRIATQHGTEGLALLFADTIIEDDDLYRFLIESALNVYGLDQSLAEGVLARVATLTPITDKTEGALERRKAELATIRAETMAILPGLHWIADGRTPWEVFRDERFIGNTRIDPCSKILKRQLMDRWRNERCDPAGTCLVFGLDWTERPRLERHRARMAPWRAAYPMDDRPYFTKDDIRADLESFGIRQPRLYDLGFPHNNCGGFCVKAGLAQMRHLNRVLPETYRYHEQEEKKSIAEIGKTAVSVLRLRSGRRSRNVTLEQFRKISERQPMLYAEHGWGCGGGCAIDVEEDKLAVQPTEES